MNTPEVGSVSHGTMRFEDLYPAFLETLRAYDPAKAAEIEKSHEDAIVTAPPGSTEQDREDWTMEMLFDALDEIAPNGCYFGSHPGDGSDFGWWYHETYEEEEVEKG